MFRPKITCAMAVAATEAPCAITAVSIGFSGTHVAVLSVHSFDASIPSNSGDRPMERSGLLSWIE